MTKGKQYSPEFKSKVALAAIRGDGTTTELASHYKIHPNMITKWKREALFTVGAAMGKPFGVIFVGHGCVVDVNGPAGGRAA